MSITKNRDSKVYLVGSGIASLASAVYLIKDTGVLGENIHILEQDDITGGACDGGGDVDSGFVIRGGRMHEKHYECYWDLLSNIPSLEDSSISVRDESFEFNERFVSHAQARLLKDGKKLDVSSFGLSFGDQADFLKLTFIPESSLGNKRIEDWFSAEFFETNFWHIWTSMFAFQRWSSLAEMRRYMKRFIHLVDGLHQLGGVMRTKYNQYHSVILPIQKYLESEGVHFDMHKQVIDIDFELSNDQKRATVIVVKDIEGKESEILLGDDDFLFITNGSITESTDNGSWDKAPILKDKSTSGSWTLWEKLAKKDQSFGNPSPFCDNIDLQKWYSFTVTLKDSTFHDYMENFSGNVDHFPNQPDDVKIFWGYGLYPDREGNFIKKRMSECTGAEILEELYYHLKIQGLMKPITESGKINCIPVAMPFVDSLFMPRTLGDRPAVIPEDSQNFAFLGQFAEVEDDCVFTVEYSVRTAQMAVFGLFDSDRDVNPIYDSIHNPMVLIKAAKAISR